MIRTRPQPRPYRRSGDGSTIGCLGVIVIVVAIIAINVTISAIVDWGNLYVEVGATT